MGNKHVFLIDRLINNEKEKPFLNKSISKQHLKRLKKKYHLLGNFGPLRSVLEIRVTFFKPLLYDFTLEGER